MRITGVIWLDSVVEKIDGKHGVSREEDAMKRNDNRKRAAARKTSVSKAGTYAEIGDFWDEHDLSEHWGATRSVRADVDLESEESLYRVEKELSETIQRAAKERGVSSHTLVNLWLQEKVQKLKAAGNRG